MESKKFVTFHVFYWISDQLATRKESLYKEIINIKESKIVSIKKRVNFFTMSYFESTLKWVRQNLFDFFYLNFKMNNLKIIYLIDIYELFNSLKENSDSLIKFKSARNIFLNNEVEEVSFNESESIHGEKMISKIGFINDFIKNENEKIKPIIKWIKTATFDRHDVAHGNDIFLENELIVKKENLDETFNVIERFFEIIEILKNKIFILLIN